MTMCVLVYSALLTVEDAVAFGHHA